MNYNKKESLPKATESLMAEIKSGEQDKAGDRDKSGKRLFIECPETVPGIEFGEPIQAEFERTVVASEFFGDDLPEGQILVQHNCWFRPVLTPVKSHLVLARVAGYRNVVYGLPELVYPILFQHPENPNVMISTTSLSNFIEGRFTPHADWRIVIERLVDWLGGGDGKEYKKEIEGANKEKQSTSNTPCVQTSNLSASGKHQTPSFESLNDEFEMSVRPAYASNAALSADVETATFQANAKWFEDNIFYEQADKMAVSEGFISGIQPSGRQSPRPPTRGDCQGEAAMIPALKWALTKDSPSEKTTKQVMDFLFNSGKLCEKNPKSPMYGGLNFYENLSCFYSDDNCRASMGCVLASELTGNFEFAKDILRCFLTILRSTGKFGFRMGRLDTPRSFENGETWKTYADEEHVEYRPHYQAYMWAGFLQAYALTGHREFRDKAENAIRMTMENAFPAKLAWTNGITQEHARIILPLAMLVEIEDTREHRGWLKTATETLLENMSECGAIQEKMGDLKYGKYPSPRTNEEYGSTEAALIQENGDPACDLVYTVNYAFIGLHEASMATGEEYYIDAENKLADFLCRIQARSEQQRYLDGCWLRGFDYELWDYYGSSADNGWGAWCVESGWTNTWIGATFGLRLLNRPLLCRESAPEYKKMFPKILEEMSILREYRTDSSAKIAKTVAPGAE